MNNRHVITREEHMGFVWGCVRDINKDLINGNLKDVRDINKELILAACKTCFSWILWFIMMWLVSCIPKHVDSHTPRYFLTICHVLLSSKYKIVVWEFCGPAMTRTRKGQGRFLPLTPQTCRCEQNILMSILWLAKYRGFSNFEAVMHKIINYMCMLKTRDSF